MAEAPVLARQASAGTMQAPANPSMPPGRVRHLYKTMDKDCNGGLSLDELKKGFAKDLGSELAPHVLACIEALFEAHAEDPGDGTKVITTKQFSRFYCEVLFAHFDKDQSGTLELDEFQAALGFLVKPDADGTKCLPVVPYPPEFTKESGEVNLPKGWFWQFFKAMP